MPVRSYEVQVCDANELTAAQYILDGHAAGGKVEVSQQEMTLRFPTTDTEQELSNVLQSLIAGGIHVAQFREVVGDLEDAFLSVAEGATGAALAAQEDADSVVTESEELVADLSESRVDTARVEPPQEPVDKTLAELPSAATLSEEELQSYEIDKTIELDEVELDDLNPPSHDQRVE